MKIFKKIGCLIILYLLEQSVEKNHSWNKFKACDKIFTKNSPDIKTSHPWNHVYLTVNKLEGPVIILSET